MKTTLTTLILSLFLTLICTAQSEDTLGGFEFTQDGFNYGAISFDPNEVFISGFAIGTFTNPLIIPSSVTHQDVTYTVVRISSFSFDENLELTSLTIPETIREIRSQAFSNTGLTEIIALGNTPATIEVNSFGDRSNIALTVPTGTEEAYLNNGWTGFATINGISGTVFEVNNITYGVSSLTNNTVDLIGSTTVLTGNLNIPATVTFNSTVYSVTAILDDAFIDNQLTSVTLPSTLTEIGSSAFRDNQLTSIQIPNSVDTLGDRAFSDNELESANIPTSLTVLESSVFRNNNITSITIPEGMITIGIFVFENNNLTTVTIPESVTSIGNFAFTSNPITAVEALGTVPPSIGTATFNEGNIDLTIPDGTEADYATAGWIGFNSVNGVVNLEVGNSFEFNGLSYTITAIAPNEVEASGGTTIPANLVIPAVASNGSTDFSVTSIGNNAFQNEAISSITIPNSIQAIGSQAFNGNPLTSITAEGNTPAIIQTNSFGDRSNIDLTVPDGTETAYQTEGWTGFATINGVIVFNVGSTFTENNFDYEVTSIAPNEVEITGGTNFPNDLIIDSNVSSEGTDFVVTSVGNSAFENGTLTSVQLPNTLRLIGNFAFQNNQIGSLTIPASVTNISTRAFRMNQIGGNLIIPNTVTTLGNGAFELNSLTGLTISENLSAIGQQTFRNNQLTTVTIPANINSLGNNCFRSNPLTEVIVLNTTPPNINSGSGDSFLNIRSNIALTVPTTTELAYLTNGWTDFGSINGQDPAFFNEFEVANITYRINSLNPNEVETASSTVTGELSIPSTVNDGTQDYTITSIGNSSFRDNQLTSVTIPNSVTSIDRDAFRDNELTSVTIPGSVTSMGIRVFRDNPLTAVIAEGIAPSSISDSGGSNDSFGLDRDNIDLFIPTGTSQDYIDNSWTGFKSTIEANKALKLKVFLQGASFNPNSGEENLMRDDLRVAGLIPNTSPYADAIAIAGDGVQAPNINDNCVDWIFVELRDANDSSIVIEGKSGFIQRDGDIVSSDGFSPFEFASQPGNYFVVIKHRNHLGIMVENATRLSSVATVIDFTDVNKPITFGTNAQSTFGMPVNTLGMWSGNVNSDDRLRFQGSGNDTNAIKDAVLADLGNTSSSNLHSFTGYNTGDVDLNGSTRFQGSGNDSNTIKDVVLSHPDNTTGTNLFLILEQLPQQAPTRMAQHSKTKTIENPKKL